MGTQEPVTRIRDTGKERRTADRIIARTLGDDRAQRVCLKFEILGIAARAHLRAQLLR